MTKHGYGTYTATDMQKYLQGTQVALNAGMDTYSREVEGMSTVKDLPKLMEPHLCPVHRILNHP